MRWLRCDRAIMIRETQEAVCRSTTLSAVNYKNALYSSTAIMEISKEKNTAKARGWCLRCRRNPQNVALGTSRRVDSTRLGAGEFHSYWWSCKKGSLSQPRGSRDSTMEEMYRVWRADVRRRPKSWRLVMRVFARAKSRGFLRWNYYQEV